MLLNSPGIRTRNRVINISAKADVVSDLSELYTSNVYPDSNAYVETKFIIEQERRQLMQEMFGITLN